MMLIREARNYQVLILVSRLNGFLGGLNKSDLIVLAGRPSMGKTALATNIAFKAAKSSLENKEPVLFFP